MLKNNIIYMNTITLILCVTLIILIILLFLVKKQRSPFKEGLDSEIVPNTETTDPTPTITSTESPGSTVPTNIYSSIDRLLLKDSKYVYCLGGEVRCSTGDLSNVTDGYSGGRTYSYLCTDQKTIPICTNNTNDLTIEEKIDYKIQGYSFPFSMTYHGFTSEYSDAPYIMNNDKIEVYRNNDLVGKVDRCQFVDIENLNDCKNGIL
jgi:hypothetical protein